MSKTTILYVRGDGDYAAMIVEDEIGIDKMFEAAKENGGRIETEFSDDFGNSESIMAIILEFGEVDPEFIGFVQQMQDYDRSKAENFFVISIIEEEK